MADSSDRDSDFASVLNITENRSKILAMIIAMVRDFDVAEDLFQETVLEILKSADRYEAGSAFVPWACGISKNVVYRYWERESRRPLPMTQETLAHLASIGVDTPPELWREEHAALQYCLEKLPQRLTRLFILRYGYNIKGQELADKAGIKRGSVRTTLARLRTRLRQCVEMQIRQGYALGDLT